MSQIFLDKCQINMVPCAPAHKYRLNDKALLRPEIQGNFL